MSLIHCARVDAARLRFSHKLAFRAAVKQYPKTRIRLRNRALVMEDTGRNESDFKS